MGSKRKNILAALVLMLFLQGCGQDHLDQDIPMPDAGASSSSPVVIPPVGGGGSSSSSGGTGTGSSSGGAVSSQAPQFIKNQSVSMSSDETYQGATSDGTSIYFLTEKSLTYPSKQRKIYKIDPSSGSKSLYCSWIDTDSIVGGFIAVGQNFYIYKSVYNKEFKRVTISGCNQLSTLVASDSPNSYLTPAMAYNGTDFFWAGRTGGYTSPYALLRVNFNSNTTTTDIPETILGDETTNWGSLKALAASGETKYAVFSPSYQTYSLWRFSSGGAVAYYVDKSLLNSYSDPSQAAMIGSTTLVLIMSEFSTLKLSYFGVGGM